MHDAGMPALTPPKLIALTVACMLFMEQLDGTILSTALPAIAKSLDITPVTASVALTSYILGLAIVIPASGAISDHLGSRRTLFLAISIFIVFSFTCGVSSNLPMLAASRTFQGMGGALMVPVGRLVLLQNVQKSELLKTMTWMMLPATLGPLLGPVLGGVITTSFSWRWNFYINIPFGLLGLLMTWRFIPEIRENRQHRFDGKGMLLAGAALALISGGGEMISHAFRPLWVALLPIGTGILLMTAYFRHMQRVEWPVLDFRLMRIATFRISVLAGAATRIAIGALPFLLPSLLQVGFGLTAARSGFITFAGAIGAVSVRAIVPYMFRTFGFRNIMLITCTTGTLAILAMSIIQPGWPLWPMAMLLGISGFIQATQFSAYNTIAYADIPQEKMSAATAFYTTFQQIMLSTGISVAAMSVTLSRMARGESVAGAFDFDMGLIVSGIAALIAIPFIMQLRKDAGSDISGHTP